MTCKRVAKAFKNLHPANAVYWMKCVETNMTLHSLSNEKEILRLAWCCLVVDVMAKHDHMNFLIIFFFNAVLNAEHTFTCSTSTTDRHYRGDVCKCGICAGKSHGTL